MAQYRLTKNQQQAFNRVMWGLILVGVGVWIGSRLFAGDSGYGTNLYTEILSISVTVGILEVRAESRAKREYQKRLVRDAGSRVNTAVSAVDEMQKQGWLTVHDDEQLLKGANLWGANLGGTYAPHANLSGANLRVADLSHTGLFGADLSGAYAPHANLSGADVGYANLSDANLWGANLSGVRLRRTNLSGANLVRADLSDADLGGADLRGASLTGANLSRASFAYAPRANLSDADLRGADLRGANLDNANLRGANLLRALLSENTTLPDRSKWTPHITNEEMTKRFGVVFNDPDETDFE